MDRTVRDAYSRRAAEYAAQLGAMDVVHGADRHLVTDWARGLSGAVMDAGCGPGHWTHHLTSLGVDAWGLDQTPEFIRQARQRYPDTTFRVGQLDRLDVASGTLAGVLAWYSLIHHHPSVIGVPLAECFRVLRPGGGLLVGFFEGPRIERFDHAVVGAYRWPVTALGGQLQEAGFDIVETHTRTGVGYRPHAAIVATRPSGSPG